MSRENYILTDLVADGEPHKVAEVPEGILRQLSGLRPAAEHERSRVESALEDEGSQES